MKKKVREITIKGNLYHWYADELFWPEVKLKIWLGPDKTSKVMDVRFNKPEAVTPRMVADIIAEAVDYSGNHELGTGNIFTWCPESKKLLFGHSN